ncbi:prephenate dehydratase [bacterium]|nr:prephenate dehydratase [bacterium]
MENNKKLLYLGPCGSYSQIAMEKVNKKILKDYEPKSISTIKKILDILPENPSYYGVLPIENSLEGIVRETIDNLASSELKIMAEILVQVQHSLISNDKIENITHIVSHPQALAQCQNYISKNFGSEIELISASSTSNSAKIVSEKGAGYASIANEYCAELYNLNILAKKINDNPANFTRFVLVGKENLNLPCNRTSLAFTTKNESGALLRVLEVFKKYDLNLIYIESRPSKKVLGEYIFFADVDKGFHMIEPAINEISSICNFSRVLGAYSAIQD